LKRKGGSHQKEDVFKEDPTWEDPRHTRFYKTFSGFSHADSPNSRKKPIHGKSGSKSSLPALKDPRISMEVYLPYTLDGIREF
jgi:hypothetical protein